jgi:hypothetical protein
MAATFVVTCPQCRKAVQVPEALQGKKIKCKDCQTVFPAVPAAAAKKAPSSSNPKTAEKKGAKQPALKDKAASRPAAQDDEEWGVVKAYGVTKESDKPRCPFCAWELEDSEAIICLHCGYNLMTRERLQEKILEPVTGWDYFVWLLPGIICALVTLACLAAIVVAVIWLVFPDEAAQGSSMYRAILVYSAVGIGFVGFFTGRFAVKRLILNPHPPDREKRIKKEAGED